MLFSTNPHNFANLKSIECFDLDPDLVEIKYAAQDNYESYKAHFIDTGMYDAKIKTHVFVTEKERQEFNKIENKTKTEITIFIQQILSEMPDRDIAAAKQYELKKQKKHSQLVSFYYELKSILENQQINTEIIEGTEDVNED